MHVGSDIRLFNRSSGTITGILIGFSEIVSVSKMQDGLHDYVDAFTVV